VSQHNQLQKSVEDNLYKSTGSYSKTTSLDQGATATKLTSQQLNTADTLGAAALQLEKERALLRETRTRLQDRELDLARARESFEGDVRRSMERPTAKEQEGEVRKLTEVLEGVEREKGGMVRTNAPKIDLLNTHSHPHTTQAIELDDLRAELYELRKQVEAHKNDDKENPRKGASMTAAIGSQLGGASGDIVTVPRAELESYKKQLEQQETLLNGFQKENDKLVLELKQGKEAWAREKGEILKDREVVNAKANK
jgi:hypothetical protein